MRRLLLFLIFALFHFAFPLFTFALTFASQNSLIVPDGTGARCAPASTTPSTP